MVLTPAKQSFYQVLEITRKYFHTAPIDGEVNAKNFPTNLFLMGLSYVLDKKHLLVGEPGFGKTTSAKVIASLFSRLPYDLYDTAQISGNPEKTEEKMIGRPDYGVMHKGLEEVVWQVSHHLPVLIVDEFPRLPPAKQEILLQGIETGRWTYLNASIYQGVKPAFITMNHPDNGKVQVIPPMLDRFHAVTEEGWFSSFAIFDIQKMRNYKKLLLNQLLTQEVMDAVTKKGDIGGTVKLVQQKYQEYLSQKKLPFLSDEHRQELAKGMMTQKVSEDALLFLQSLDAELNYSYHYGRKRSSEPPSHDNHDAPYLGVLVKNATSPRGIIEGILDYSKGLSYLLDENVVTLPVMRFIAPHILAHRLQFVEEFRNEYANEKRKSMESLFLAEKLIDQGFEHYQTSIEPIKGDIVAVREGNQAAIEKMKVRPHHDHPLQNNIIEELKSRPPFYLAKK